MKVIFFATVCFLMSLAYLHAADSVATTASTPASPDETLYHAAEQGDLAAAINLINKGASVNAGSGRYQFTPLMGAASGGHMDVLSYLIAHGSKLDQGDTQGSTALLHACNDNQTEAALALLKAGANPNVGSHFNRFPLMYAAQKGNDTIVAALIAAKANLEATTPEGNTALMAAACGNAVQVIGDLVLKGAKIDAQNQEGKTALILAITTPSKDAFQALLDYHANLEIKDKKGFTALIQACRMRENDIATELVIRGVDVNAVDNRGETALTQAGNQGELDMVKVLASNGATRTDLHIIPIDDPPEPLSLAHAWALAVGAVYTQRDDESHKSLGGGARDPSIARKMLRDSWKITNKAGLIKEIDDLQNHGHHEQYQKSGAALLMMTPDQFQKILSEHSDTAVQIKAIKDSYQVWTSRSGLAWDLCRASMLVNHAFAARYINETEAWNLLMPIARQTQQKFSSWKEMSDNFLDGRKIWDHKQSIYMVGCTNLLLNPKDPNSPWNYLPWATDLSGE